MSFRDFVGSLMDSMREAAQVKTVFGDPIRVEERTIIPVAKTFFGFGSLPVRSQGTEDETPTPAGTREGGGVSASPLGVLEVTKDGTQFIQIQDTNPAKIVAAFAVGLMLGALLVARGRRPRAELTD